MASQTNKRKFRVWCEGANAFLVEGTRLYVKEHVALIYDESAEAPEHIVAVLPLAQLRFAGADDRFSLDGQ